MLKESDKIVFLNVENILTAFNDQTLKTNKVSLLNSLIESENVYIVLCKSKNDRRDLKDLRVALPHIGLKTNRTILLDKVFNDQISRYIMRNRIKNYVIISNFKNNDPNIEANRIVIVDPHIGLTKANVDQAISILNGTIQISESVLFNWRQKVLDLMSEQDLNWKSLGEKIDIDRSNLRKMVTKGNVTITTLNRIFEGLNHTLIIDVKPN